MYLGGTAFHWHYISLQTELLEELAERYLALDHCGQGIDCDALLRHGVAVTYRHGVVLERLVVNRNAEGLPIESFSS